MFPRDKSVCNDEPSSTRVKKSQQKSIKHLHTARATNDTIKKQQKQTQELFSGRQRDSAYLYICPS